MKIFLGSDHAAFNEKESVKTLLLDLGHDVVDCGTNSLESTHYPIFAERVARGVREDENSRGILLCGSGIGVSMVANRFSNIRAALCRTISDVSLSREHNNSNVLCFGARVTSMQDIKKMIDTWLSTPFEGGRHANRVEMFNNWGEK